MSQAAATGRPSRRRDGHNARVTNLPTPDGPPLKVWLVDDNPGDLDLVRETLEEGCCPVRLSLARSGQAALELLHRNMGARGGDTPDLVLLDLNMPGVNGREVLCEMRRLAPQAPPWVVVLTSSDAEQDIQDSRRLGADGCITKPLCPQGWQRLVDRLRPRPGPAGPNV